MMRYNLCPSGMTVRTSGDTLRRRSSAEAPVTWPWRIITRCSWPWHRLRLHRVTGCSGGERSGSFPFCPWWPEINWVKLSLCWSFCFGVKPGELCRVTPPLLGASGHWRTVLLATCSTTLYGAAKRKSLVFLLTVYCNGLSDLCFYIHMYVKTNNKKNLYNIIAIWMISFYTILGNMRKRQQ